MTRVGVRLTRFENLHVAEACDLGSLVKGNKLEVCIVKRD